MHTVCGYDKRDQARNKSNSCFTCVIGEEIPV